MTEKKPIHKIEEISKEIKKEVLLIPKGYILELDFDTLSTYEVLKDVKIEVTRTRPIRISTCGIKTM